MARLAFGGGREKCESRSGDESREQRPSQNAAHAQCSQQSRSAKRPEHGAESVHRALEAEGATGLSRRHGIGEQRVARRPAAAATNPSQCAQQQHNGPSLREGVTERRETCCKIPDDAGRLAQYWAVGDPAAGELRETRKAVGNAFDHAERNRRRAQAREKGGQNCCGCLVPPIREKAC